MCPLQVAEAKKRAAEEAARAEAEQAARVAARKEKKAARAAEKEARRQAEEEGSDEDVLAEAEASLNERLRHEAQEAATSAAEKLFAEKEVRPQGKAGLSCV